MKKLSLGKLKLLEGEVLDRIQMANIYGGDNVGLFNCQQNDCTLSTGCWDTNCCCDATVDPLGSTNWGYCVDMISGQCP